MLLKARFVRENGRYTACSISGHDEITDDTAFSVLCAAVSSAMQLTCNTLTECFGIPSDAVTVTPSQDAHNNITIRLHHPDLVQSEILHGLLLHVSLLAEDAPDLLQVSVSEQ